MVDPYLYITSTGVIVPDTSTILLETQTEYKTVFGQDLIVTADTPQGVLIVAESLARAEVVNNNAALANMINPNVAGGVYLDSIMALLGLQRTPATKTLVSGATLTGVSGTIVNAGTQAQTAVGDLFESLSTVVIPIGGSIDVDFQAVEYGAVACGIGDLTQIVTSVLGWETVNNTVAGVPGTSTQSDAAARARRNNILAFQAVSIVEAITSALYYVEGITSLSFLENVADTEEVLQGITMAPHSVWACVNGGSDLDVAAALLENKSSGSAWNGDESVTVVEPASGQEYTVLFDRPEEIEVLIRVTTPNGNSADIKAAILEWASNGVAGIDGFKVGTDVSPFEIAAAVNAAYPSTFISKVEVSAADPISYSTNTMLIAINEIATTEEAFITVVIS